MRTAFLAVVCLLGGSVALAADYLAENVSDTTVHMDEALVNVVLASNQWPDCTTMRSAMADIFRLEGVTQGTDQEKALAFWKWFRILVSSTGGSYAYEGPKGREDLVKDSAKIFQVYGHHQCDGLSWAMVGLWRAADLMALDECTLGHTTAALRYRDADGQMRYHSFDPQGRFYYWDGQHERVGTRSLPVMSGMVYRHVMQPREVHSLRTSLRWGEIVDRKWQNEGYVVPSGKPGSDISRSSYYAYEPGKTKGIYACVGEEVQTFEVPTTPERFRTALYAAAETAACSPPGPGRAAIHPSAPGAAPGLVYRLAPPYVAVDGVCEATLLKGAPGDTCRLSLSVDGLAWQVIYEKETVGEETVKLEIGRAAREKGLPNVYTAYHILIKAEFSVGAEAGVDVQRTGMKALKVVLRRMLNRRTLPNLRPGENVLRLTADRLAEGAVLEVAVRYHVSGEARQVVRTVRRFPYYFLIDVPGVQERVLENYDQDFNNGDLRMDGIQMRLIEAGSAGPEVPSLDEAEAAPRFAAAYPHPADMTDRKQMKTVETDVIQTNGFLPQSRERRAKDERFDELVKTLKSGETMNQWRAAEELGNYPEAVDVLLEALPAANIDLTLFIVKALAQIGDKKAVGPLLEKWRRHGPNGAPGTRYIPDALAVLADEKVVPDLVAVLPRCRFDYRFHIAHALGLLGGPLAQETLKDLAANDPFPPVRDVAKEALARVRQEKP